MKFKTTIPVRGALDRQYLGFQSAFKHTTAFPVTLAVVIPLSGYVPELWFLDDADSAEELARFYRVERGHEVRIAVYTLTHLGGRMMLGRCRVFVYADAPLGPVEQAMLGAVAQNVVTEVEHSLVGDFVDWTSLDFQLGVDDLFARGDVCRVQIEFQK